MMQTDRDRQAQAQAFSSIRYSPLTIRSLARHHLHVFSRSRRIGDEPGIVAFDVLAHPGARNWRHVESGLLAALQGLYPFPVDRVLIFFLELANVVLIHLTEKLLLILAAQ